MVYVLKHNFLQSNILHKNSTKILLKLKSLKGFRDQVNSEETQSFLNAATKLLIMVYIQLTVMSRQPTWYFCPMLPQH